MIDSPDNSAKSKDGEILRKIGGIASRRTADDTDADAKE